MSITPHSAMGTQISDRTARIEAVGFDYSKQEMTAILSCNLCGTDKWTIITHTDRYGFPAQAATCQLCGLTVLNPRMKETSYETFYKETYRRLVSAFHGRRIDAATVQNEQALYAIEMATLLRPYLNARRNGSFLDVGGSTGVVAAHFVREFGVRATVLDPAPAEIAEAKALDVSTITSLVEDWDPADAQYDVIGLFQTIDHLLDVSGTLRKLRHVLKSDGLLVVDIVDFRAAYLKNWCLEAAIKIDHPFSLTEETMAAFLARAGFCTLRKAYSKDYHLVTYICVPCTGSSEALPSAKSVERLMREMRFVQNTPGGTRCSL